MGCHEPRLLRKRRKHLLIWRHHDASDISDQSSDCQVVEAQICDLCDQEFDSVEQLEQHQFLHVPSSTSQLVSRIEDDIFQEILSDKTCVDLSPDKSQVSSSLLHSYEDLIDNLISSSSPDELLDKIVINTEFPDNYKHDTSTTVSDDKPSVSREHKNKKPRREKRPAPENKSESTKELKKLKTVKQPDLSEPGNIQRPESRIDVRTESLEFSFTFPVLSCPELVSEEVNIPVVPEITAQHNNTSQDRLKLFRMSEKYFDDKYANARKKLSNANAIKVRDEKRRRRCKRGTLAHQVYLDLKNVACSRKNAKDAPRIDSCEDEDDENIVDDVVEQDSSADSEAVVVSTSVIDRKPVADEEKDETETESSSSHQDTTVGDSEDHSSHNISMPIFDFL